MNNNNQPKISRQEVLRMADNAMVEALKSKDAMDWVCSLSEEQLLENLPQCVSYMCIVSHESSHLFVHDMKALLTAAGDAPRELLKIYDDMIAHDAEMDQQKAEGGEDTLIEYSVCNHGDVLKDVYQQMLTDADYYERVMPWCKKIVAIINARREGIRETVRMELSNIRNCIDSLSDKKPQR